MSRARRTETTPETSRNPQDGPWLRRVVRSDGFRNAVIALILFNAVVIGLQTSDRIVAQYGEILSMLDQVILAIFVAELALRLAVDGRDEVRTGWFWFDAIVIAIAILPLPGNLAVIRTLRVLRVLRLLTVSQQMRRVVSGLLNAIPGMATVIGVLVVVFYVFAVFATETFGESVNEESRMFFATLGDSLFTLFQIMTLEDWSSVARPLMDEFAWAWVFFLMFVTVTAFAVLNLFIGIIVDAMQDDRDEALKGAREQEEEFIAARFEELSAQIKTLQNEISELRGDLNRRDE